jgi:hypothetical protein
LIVTSHEVIDNVDIATADETLCVAKRPHMRSSRRLVVHAWQPSTMSRSDVAEDNDDANVAEDNDDANTHKETLGQRSSRRLVVHAWQPSTMSRSPLPTIAMRPRTQRR